MAVEAKLRFRQGVNVGNPGQAFFGELSTPVIIENTNNLGVENWSFEIVDVPTGSVVVKGLVQDRGTNPTYSFSPDVRGGYLCTITVRDKFGNASSDTREFGVLRVSGRHIPSFRAIDQSLNYPGNGRGWAKFMDEWLDFIDSGGGGLSRVTYDFLNGEESTDLTTVNPQVIGAIYFDPNSIIPVSSGRVRHVDFECVIESSIGTSYAQLDVYDVNGISTGGTPGVVTNSTKQTTNLAPTRFTQNLDASLGSITTAGLLEARLAIQAPGPGFATCKLARLIVTWE